MVFFFFLNGTAEHLDCPELLGRRSIAFFFFFYYADEGTSPEVEQGFRQVDFDVVGNYF